MIDIKRLKQVYATLQQGGYNQDFDTFKKGFAGNENYANRKKVYDLLSANGAQIGKTYEEFMQNMQKPKSMGNPTVNKYRQQMFNSVDPNKSRASELTHRAVSQAKRAMNNVRKPVTAKVVDKKGNPTGEEFAITPAKTVEDLYREYAQETVKNWENELHDQMADADKDAAKISDMFKSFIGSTNEVGSVWGNMTRGGGIAGTPHSVTTNNGILENIKARQLLAARDYNRKRKELLQLELDSRNGAIFDDHSFFRGMYDAAKDTGFLTGGASDIINAGSLLATKQDLDNGIHTEAGDMLMQQSVKNSDAQSQYGDNKGWMYTGGVITTNMAPFMLQIASAGFSKGLSTSIGKVVQGAASKVALGTMKKAAGFASVDLAKNIGKVTGLTTKAFGKAIQYGIVGAAQANTVGLGNVANDVINRYTGQVYQDEQGNYKFGTFDSDGKLVHEGGEDFLTALVKGEAAQTIEFATELAGGGIDAAGTALKNFVTKGGKKIINKYNMENVSKVIDFLLNNKVSKNARYLKAGADRTLGKVEVNSIIGESLEEELGIIANTVFTGDNKISDLWDEKQQSQIWGGMLLSIGLMKGAVAPFHAYNAKQYYSYKHKLNKADVNLSQLLGKEKWEELRNQIDATTNEDMPEMVNKINRDVALGKNRQPVREYIQNLLIMRGYDIGNMLAAKKAVEDKGEGVSVKNMEKNQAYQQGRDAYGYDTHEIQLDQEDKQKSLAQLLGISEQQLASMSDEELESFSGRDDNIDGAIYDYQLSSARYEGVVDNARDQIDLEVQRAARAVDMYTDKSRNTIRNATIKASGGLEDYGVYIISGNIATHDDGSIDVSNSDDMILYYDPTTNTVEHADAMMFAELGSEENADEVRSQAMADAKEKAIKETTGIIDGVVEVGTQFKTVDADGTEHTYEVLADNGDGTAMITIDGNVPTELVKGENVQVPVSFEELQKMKDESDQQRLQAAKAEREQMEKERAEQQKQAQTTQVENPALENNTQSAHVEDNLDYSDIIREDGKVQMVDVSDKDGNNLFPDAKDVFYIQGNKIRTKFAYIDANGELKTQSFPTGLVKIKTRGEVSVDDYKKYRATILSAESSAMPETSMIEDNSGENRGKIEVEAPTIEGETAAPETTETPATEQAPATPAITLEDGTIVPMLEDGNPDFSKLTAAQTAELYDSQFGEDADSIVSGYVSDAKKALDKANNMTVKGKTFVEQKASKDAKEKAIADAQAAYDSAIAIRDAYNERQLAKEQDTAEGRKNLIEKARRKFARLKSAVKDDADAVAQIYKETVGSLLHRIYDGTGIDVTDTNPLTAEEYVASNLGAHSLNYEGTETSKGVKQETGLSREDFAKTQLLAADGKGTTIDNLVHSLWENRPSNLDSLNTQDIRNALIGVLTSGFKASEARSYVENIRIAQAEKLIEEERTAAENAAYYEQQKAKEEEEKKKAELEKKAEEEKKNAEEEKTEDNEQTKFPDKLQEESNAIEVPEDATDENPLGLQLSKDKVPFKIEGGKSGETYDINDKEDRKRLVAENSVDDKDILDIDMPKHVHKAIKELCKKMGLKVQFLYMGARLNGWIENGTMYLALDTEKATQFVFGHEMTHAIKQKNPEAYKELAKVAMVVTTRKKFEEDLAKVYRIYHNASGYNNIDDFVEEVIADNIGKFINDHDLAQRFVLRLNHPVLATILHAIQKIKSLLYGDFYKSVDALERIVEKAYVDTANGQITNSETGEDVSFSLRQKPEPKKKGVGYKVFVLKDGKLYPPMVANPDGAATPVGVWLDADAAPIAGESKTGRPQVKQGGKGTQGGSGKLAYRPGWHLGVVPYAIQFNRKDAEGNKTLFPKNFVFAEVEYAADVDYQEEARQEGINPSGKYQHSLAGLKHLPTDGYYMYRTNPNPETDPWVITGAMKVNRILTRAEQAELVKNAGREPQQIQEGDIVTDDVVSSINQEIADAPKLSLKVYHGSGADFTEQTKFSLRLKSAIEETETNPSDAQKESGNYKKGHIKFGGYDYTIENPKGSTRSGKDADGKEWKVIMHDTYGYIRGKFGKDGDHLDMFINDKADLDNWNGDVFVIDQVNPDGSFDEHKVMYGYDSMDDAEKAYLANYSKGWQGLGNITGVSKDEFDKWLDTSNRKLKPFADYAKVKFSFKDIKPVGVGAFGNIYNQFRGNAKAAIEFLKKVRGGEAVGALHHKDIGDIDLVWGKEGTGHSDGYGLSKLVKYHPEVLDNLQEILNDMRVVSSSKNRVNLESETHKAGVRLTWDGERKSWLLTAFKKETSASDKRTDTAATSLEGDTALSQTEGSAAKIDNSSETSKKNGEKFSLKDDEYLKAVENGDMEKAQKMVNEAAEAAGYSTDSSYQGTSAFNGSAPWGNGYFLTKEERKEAWDNDEYDGDQTLGDYIHRGIDAMNLDFIALDPRNYRAADHMRKEAIDNVRNAIQKKSETITMYRSVPSDVKEGSFRNGDWVTPSRAYAVENAKVHGWGDNFNIIEQKVPVDEIWWDGNDIAEWGYGREEDYVNDTDFAYKNTKNNRKLLDAVTYDDNGNVIPLSQRFNENNADVRYSLKDEKTMFGMHNISLDKLRKAIKQGGFAAPSMGVIDSKNGIYSGFGEITLIPKAEKIAKRTGKNIGTYAADAWTPIYPPVEKKFGGNGGDVAYDDIESVPKEMQSITRNAINGFMDGRDANSLAYLYLHEKGKAPELVHVEGKYPKELHDEVKGILGKSNGIYNTTDEQKEKLLDLFIREVYDGNREEFDNDIKNFIKKDEEFIKKRPNSNIAKNKQLDVDWMKEHGYDYGALSRFVDGIQRDIETSDKVDTNATIRAAQQYISKNGLKNDFYLWKENLNDRYQVEEVIFAGYKPDGNRKYLPNTVENAVKVMKQDGKNASVGSASFSHFVASILKPMGTLDQIRKKKGNLTGNYEDVEKFQEKWQPVYDELADKMQPDAEPFESYGMDRLEDAATQKNPKKYAKDEYGVDLTDEDIDKLNELIDAVKNEKPSIYFETKFMRPYGLDEFEKAIVPNDTPSDVVDALKMAGIDVSSYERGNAEDRQKVTMDAINSSDNIRFSLKEEKEKIVADAKANGTYMTAPNGEKTKLDAEQWATVRTANFKNWFGDWENDPENASKVVDENGEPMVMYHYTDESFTIFGKDKEVGKNTFGNATNASYAATTTIGHWFTSNKKQPEYMGKPMECFLNIVEPFDGYTLEGLADYLNNYISDEDFNSYEEDYENVAPIIEAGNNFREEQIRDGYDGVVIDDEEFGGTSYVAFNANQIKSAENNNGDFSADNNDIRFSLAGERGAAAADKAEERTFRMDNLSVAKDMEKNKKKAKAIKAATGWERGADGKWRYEMPDVVLRDPKEWVNKKTLTLSDIVEKPNDLFKEYPELFDAYPELKDMKILKGRAKSGGVFYNNAITLNLGDIREAIKYDMDTHYKLANNSLKKTLVHEIQHYIQDKEGFAQGGNSEMIIDKNALDAIAKLRAEKDAVAKEFYAMSSEEKQRRKYEINNRYNDLTKQIERLEKSSRIGYDGYQRLAGEVEARNVSARLNMTPEERRKSLAESTEDMVRKDQIFLGVGDVSFSLRDMADGKESGAADMAEDLKSLNTHDEVDDAIKTAIEDMPSGWKMANKKMIHIAQALGENRKAEIAGEEPKFSLKDGSLIKAGTYFSGGGLVEEGLKGIIDPVVAVEYDEKISGVYRNNFGQHIVTADVRDVDPKELIKQIDGEVEYFHASPVCKNYSQAKSNHAELELDKETAASTADFINAVKPKVVTIENVKGYKDSDAMKTITDALDANGYTWDADVYNAADYGGYTNRERLIVRAVRDGKLPAKPKKMAHKSGWYEAVADIIPTLTEKKNGVAPWMDVRLKADGIDWRNIDKPLYVMGSAYADGKVPHAFADELLPTLRTKSGDVIVMPDGKVYRAMGRVLARVSGVSDDYKMPFSESLSHTIIGNGIPTQLTEHVIAPLLQNTLRPTTPEDGNTKFSLRGSTPYDKQMEEWMEKNHLEKGAVPMEKPVMKEGENIFDYANRMVEWTRNQNLWKTAPKQTGFQDALAKWKADNGLSPDAYPPVRPHREYYSTEIGYTEDLEEYNKKKKSWKSAPKPKDFDLSVDLEDMNKQLRNIRRAVLNQKNYDQRTVKAVSDLVRKMLNIGWGDGLSRGKVGNLLSAAKNATGANDVKKYLDKAMGILAENYLNRLSTAYDNLINTKGARADQSGVIKMGSLDANGQAFMSEYKKAINMDDKSLNNYIANIEEDSAKNEDNVEMNDYRLAGIQAAIMYKQQIGGNDADIAELKRQIGELKNKKDVTKEDKDLLKSLEKKLFENKFDRITMFENLLNNIQRMVKESKGRAKEFRDEIAEHKNEILHRANLDLEGVDSSHHHTQTWKKKFWNNPLFRFVMSSTYTFEQFLKYFGRHHANGEGYLYNYFMSEWHDAADEQQLYNEMNRNALDEKTKELFGKKKFMKLVGIDGNGMKEMDIDIADYSNKETGKRTIHLKQGQMLYIYLVNKETDGEMKLRAMGITEEDVAAIEANLDPRVKAMGEWLQDEYLPECQRRYQATHTKYFGAPMKEVENYFPLAIDQDARNQNIDINQNYEEMSRLAGTSTGAIVTRRVNVIPLDIENADAFAVAFNHLDEMEEWSAYLPFKQDINTLLSYTHFKNQVKNMSSAAYGNGETLWKEFMQTAQIAAGTYRPKVDNYTMDGKLAALAGGIATAKISGRLWTAIKQSQSATVFLPECDFGLFVKNSVKPYGSYKWAKENLPLFRKRIEGLTIGDMRIKQFLDDVEKYHDWAKAISKFGMSANILVDSVTCAVGARSVYETELKKLTKLGYSKEKAEEKALLKASLSYNKTQQSSEGAFLSPMQVDRTYVSAALSLFKNANYAYGRGMIEACRGLAKTYDLWGGKHKITIIESMTRQIMREDGLDESIARAIARKSYYRTFRKSIGMLLNYLTLVPVSWAAYKVLPYLLTGDDDDKKQKMIEDAVLKGFSTSITDNYVIPFLSNGINAAVEFDDNGSPTLNWDKLKYQNLYINPATSDLANIYSMVANQKWYAVGNKIGMLGVQSLIGFNPETLGALYQLVSEGDFKGDNTNKEVQIAVLKAISAPEESIRELYMDELGLNNGDKDVVKKFMSKVGLDGDDITKIPLSVLEQRYAERQINRDNLLSQIFMPKEDFDGYVEKYKKSFEKKIQEKMDKMDAYDQRKFDAIFDTTTDPALKGMMEKKRTKDANAAADEQIAKEGLNQEKKGKEPSEEAYDAVKMSIDVAEDNAISTYNKVLNKRYAALNDEYNEQTDAMKYIFMSKHPNFKAYKELESEYTNYGKKIKELKEKLVSADGYDAKQTILKQIRAEREKFSELQSKVR